MDSVVNTEAYGNDYVDTGYDIYCDIPEVEETNDVSESDDDHTQDREADLKVGHEEQSDQEDTDHGQPYISSQLIANNLISVPGSIYPLVREVVGRVN